MDNKPTESELAILQVLWQRGKATVRDVHEDLAVNKKAGYTTTLKLMQIMDEKGLVRRDTSSRTHVYEALYSQEQARTSALDKILSTVFRGSASQLVIQALGHHLASGDEIDVIRKYLQEFDNENRKPTPRGKHK